MRMILAASLLLACTPTDDNEAVTFLREVEPNSSKDEAQMLGEPGLYSFQGACSSTDREDWFTGNTSGGVIEVSVFVRTEPSTLPEDWEPEDTDVAPIANVAIKSASLAVLGETQVTPDAPAEIAAASQFSGAVYVQIGCPDRTLWYTGIVRVP